MARELADVAHLHAHNAEHLQEQRERLCSGRRWRDRLEKLKGDRANSSSIRINDQWRICLRWTTAGPEDVGIVDSH